MKLQNALRTLRKFGTVVEGEYNTMTFWHVVINGHRVGVTVHPLTGYCEPRWQKPGDNFAYFPKSLRDGIRRALADHVEAKMPDGNTLVIAKGLPRWNTSLKVKYQIKIFHPEGSPCRVSRVDGLDSPKVQTMAREAFSEAKEEGDTPLLMLYDWVQEHGREKYITRKGRLLSLAV